MFQIILGPNIKFHQNPAAQPDLADGAIQQCLGRQRPVQESRPPTQKMTEEFSRRYANTLKL